jgi:hypothetical protein
MGTIKYDLERFRHALYTGEALAGLAPWRHEDYIDYYENQIERNPSSSTAEKLQTEAVPLLAIYRKKLEDIARMEQLICGTSKSIVVTDEEVFEELYDEIVNIDTEEEWQQFLESFC